MHDRNTPDATPRSLLPLKPLEFSVLLALAEEELHGYGIVKRIGDHSGGSVQVAPGNLYQVLDRMIGTGLVERVRRRDADDLRRRYYGITSLGRQVVVAEAARLRELLRRVDRLDIRPATESGG